MYHGVTQKADDAEDPKRDEADRKERVLHTRVPAVLEAELKRFAQNLRIPVSNLVRTILEDALVVADAAGDRVEERLRKAATQIQSERERLRRKIKPDPLSDVYAFQQVTIAQSTSCAKCEALLEPGDAAHLGLIDPTVSGGIARVFVCDACLPNHSDPQKPKEESTS
jgi:RNase P subunit RPR2